MNSATGVRKQSARYRYSISLGGRMVGMLLQLVTVALLARSLTVSEFGVFAMVAASSSVASSIVDPGSGAILLRLRAESEPYRVLATIGVVRVFVSVVIVGLAVGVAELSAPTLTWLVLSTAVYATGESAGDLAVSAFQGQLMAKTAMTVLCVRRIVAVLPFAFGLAHTQTIWALVGAGLVGHLAWVAVVIKYWARPVTVREYFKKNLAISLTSLGRSLGRLDVLVVGAAGSASLAGYYGASSRLANPLNFAVNSLTQVLIPELSSLGPQQRLQLFYRARKSVGLFSLAIACFSPFAALITELMFGAGFEDAAPITAAVIVGASFSAFAQVHMSYFFATRIPSTVVWGATAGNVLALCYMSIAASIWGVWGISAAYVAWRGVSLTMILIGWRRQRHADRRTGAWV